jgi:hypothetical protein
MIYYKFEIFKDFLLLIYFNSIKICVKFYIGFYILKVRNRTMRKLYNFLQKLCRNLHVPIEYWGRQFLEAINSIYSF